MENNNLPVVVAGFFLGACTMGVLGILLSTPRQTHVVNTSPDPANCDSAKHDLEIIRSCQDSMTEWVKSLSANQQKSEAMFKLALDSLAKKPASDIPAKAKCK